MTEPILIPSNLAAAGARFVLVKASEKVAFEPGWEINNYDSQSPRFREHLNKGGNYGVLSHNGICCIDVDNAEEFKKNNPEFPPTFLVQRGNHYHVYFRCPDCPEDMRKKFVVPLWGDVRMGGNFYTVGPNCIHPSGDIYKIKLDVPLADIKWDDIKKLLGKQQASDGKKELFVMPVKSKQRHYTIRSLVCSMVSRGNVFDAILAACQAENLATCDPPKDPDFITKEVTSLYEYCLKKQEQKEREKAEKQAIQAIKIPQTSLLAGAEDLLKNHHPNTAIAKFLNKTIGRDAGDNDRVRFCTTDNLWYVWNGAWWERDETNTVLKMAWDYIFALQVEACNLHKVDLQKQILKSESDGEILGALTLLKTEVSVTTNDFDTDNNLLNVLNGTINLLTGELESFNKSDLITKIAPVTYDKEAKCPKWDDHLKLVFYENVDLIAAVQRAFGYSLLGGNAENKMFIPYGGGENGKTVTVNTIGLIVGDYGISADPTTFYVKSSDGPRTDIARMKGARIVSAAEGTAGKQFDESLIKQLTGGDPVTARYLYGREFNFKPTASIWYHTNHLPKIRDRDKGIWRRPYPIPFTASIPADKKVKDYDVILYNEEGSGILNWLLTGLKLYLNGDDKTKSGLLFPKAITDAIEQYRIQTDVLAEFMENYVITGNEKDRIARGDLWTAYKTHQDSEKAMPKSKFNAFIEERVGPAKRFDGGMFWIGIKQIGQTTITAEESPVGLALQGDKTALYNAQTTYDREHGRGT